MPTEKVGKVLKPGGWLRASLERREKNASEQSGPAVRQQLTQEEIKRHRAGWTDEWLRRRKEGLRKDFQELDRVAQQELLDTFRQELKTTSQSQFLKRFESSGWEHRMVRDIFMKFLGIRYLGVDWNKPNPTDIIEIAAELASKN